MKSHTEYLTFKTRRRREYINVTDRVETALEKSGITEGLLMVGAMHITAAVYINDAESGLIQDIDDWLQKLAPDGVDYRHHRTGEDNGRRSSEKSADRPPGSYSDYRRTAGFRPLAAGVLCRV